MRRDGRGRRQGAGRRALVAPETGHFFDDTKRYIDGVATLKDEDRRKIFEGNARKLLTRLAAKLPQ